MSYMDDIKAFHEKYALAYKGDPRALPPSLRQFRERFLREELKEYAAATAALAGELRGEGEPSFDDEVAHQLEHALDALVDLVYVALGTAYLHGFDFDAAWDRVHEANMSKVRVASRAGSKRRSTADVVKPAGWRPPRHRDLVVRHAHRDR